MNLLTQLLAQGIGGQGQKKPQASGGRSRPTYTPPQRLMQVNPDGSHGLSNQGHLPPELQQDTWLSNDPTAMRAPARRTMQQREAMPFKMYEDQSFQGDPRQFMQQNPGFQFYEDGSFAAPQGQPRTRQQIQQAPFKMYEDQSFQGDPRQFSQQNPGYKFYEDNSFSAPADPLAELRRFLGF